MSAFELECSGARRLLVPERCRRGRSRSRRDAGCGCSVSRCSLRTVVSWGESVLVRFASAGSFGPATWDLMEDYLRQRYVVQRVRIEDLASELRSSVSAMRGDLARYAITVARAAPRRRPLTPR